MKAALPRGRITLAHLLKTHPDLKGEVARLIAAAASTGSRKAHRVATFQDMRNLGTNVLRTLNALAAEVAETVETNGLTLDNSWKLSAFAALAKELYPVGRDALGIAPLAPIRDNPKQKHVTDWRSSLLEIESQAAAVRDPDAQVPESPADLEPPTDMRE